MADCVCLPKCIFFHDKMADMPTTAARMKERLCRGDSHQCARFMVFSALGREKVPPDLYPNSINQAKDLIAASA